MDSTKPPLTIGDLRERISKLPSNIPLIYSIDDEGNEYRAVTNLPNIIYTKKEVNFGDRYIEFEENDDDEDPKGYIAVIIN